MTGILSTERHLKTNTAIRKVPCISSSLPPPSSSPEMINSFEEGRVYNIGEEEMMNVIETWFKVVDTSIQKSDNLYF